MAQFSLYMDIVFDVVLLLLVYNGIIRSHLVYHFL